MQFRARTKWIALAGAMVAATGAAWMLHGGPEQPCSAGDACRPHTTGTAANPQAVAEDGPRLLVFSSASCPACERMKPVVRAAEQKCNGEHEVVHVDVDDEPGTSRAAAYDVNLLPSFVSVDAEGHEVARLVGVQPAERIEHAIEEIRGVRCASTEAPESSKKL